MCAKSKLKKFEQNKTFPHFFEPKLLYTGEIDFEFKGKWNSIFFKNNNDIIVEFGCGKGEYSLAMAKEYSEKNFIGFDIKGARMWQGAKDSLQLNLKNIAFVRTLIDLTPYCFEKEEVSEIWLTFPDPQLSPKKRIKKRLTSSNFLSKYQKFLKHNGIINLKTDDDTLYEYTKKIIEINNLNVFIDTKDLYTSIYYKDLLTIQTHYEKIWNKANKTIKYLKFSLPNNQIIIEPMVND